jgi:C_GCAxxG_C_C family probable redox protein
MKQNTKEYGTDGSTQEIILSALQHGKQGRSCSEAIMLAFCPDMDISPEHAIKLASGLGGGVGLSGGICGAVLAGCLVIGACLGTHDAKDGYARQNTYLIVQEFMAWFERRFGSIICRDLCYARLKKGEGFSKVREMDLVSQIVGESAAMLAELLAEQENAA